jgi:heme-binding NEAT domain protein
MTSKYIDALLAERAGYERRRLPERVKAVDAVLRELGYDHKYMTQSGVETAAVEPAVEVAAEPKRTKRTNNK